MIERENIVAATRRWIGTPYAHQASLIGVGCDCLGLVRGVWREMIGVEPEAMTPYAPHWPLATRKEWLRDAALRHLSPVKNRQPQPGDALLFRWRDNLPASHIAILASESSFVHAHEGAAVAEISFVRWWRRHLVESFSFPGVAG